MSLATSAVLSRLAKRFITGSSGNLYGTTLHGGAGLGKGKGVVFNISPSGTETVLYAFKGGGRDGANPFAGLICRPCRQSLWHDVIWRRVEFRRGVQALAGRDRDGAVLLLQFA